MDDTDLIASSLQLVADRGGDPAAQIYARLFAELPESEGRFARDVSGSIRAEMLMMVFQCLMDPAGPYQLNLVRAERVNHEGFGTPGDEFDRFFGVVHEACRTLCGPDWTPEFDAAWARRIALLTTRTASPAV